MERQHGSNQMPLWRLGAARIVAASFRGKPRAMAITLVPPDMARARQSSRPRGEGLWIVVILTFALVAASTTPNCASDVELPALAGHPRSRFPLPLYTTPIPDQKLDAELRRAVDDWNLLFRKTFGVH